MASKVHVSQSLATEYKKRAPGGTKSQEAEIDMINPKYLHFIWEVSVAKVLHHRTLQLQPRENTAFRKVGRAFFKPCLDCNQKY